MRLLLSVAVVLREEFRASLLSRLLLTWVLSNTASVSSLVNLWTWRRTLPFSILWRLPYICDRDLLPFRRPRLPPRIQTLPSVPIDHLTARHQLFIEEEHQG